MTDNALWRLKRNLFKHLSQAVELAKLVLLDMGYVTAALDNLDRIKLSNLVGRSMLDLIAATVVFKRIQSEGAQEATHYPVLRVAIFLPGEFR